jgi:hypothetical protein
MHPTQHKSASGKGMTLPTALSIFSQIRSRCAQVAGQAEFVTIHKEKIPSYVKSLPVREIQAAGMSSGEHYLGHAEGTLNFILVLDCINFGSGYSTNIKKRPGLGFYNTIASSLKDYYQRLGPPSAAELTRFTGDQCCEIFSQDRSDPVVMELMGLFAQGLNTFGNFLLDRYKGDVVNLMADADRSAAKLVSILAQMPFYADVHSYGGLEVPFMKRAQITASDLNLAFDNRSYGFFEDINEVTMFADNGIPQILVHDGLMSYNHGLDGRIQKGDLLRCGSLEEVEIRACSVHTIELMAEELKAQGSPEAHRLIDTHLWICRQRPDFKAGPTHRTRCVFY